MRFNKLYFFAFLGCLLAASVTYFFIDGKGIPKSGAGANPSASFAIPVEGKQVVQRSLSESIVTVGTLKAHESIMIRPELVGRIVELYFKEGQTVQKGDLLLRLDDSLQQPNIAESEANLLFSKVKNQRQSSLYQKNYTSGEKKDEATTKLKMAQALLERKKAELDKTKIYAPFEGVIGIKKISVGEYVQPGQDLVMLVDLNPMVVEFCVPEIYYPQVHVGQKIEITSDAYPDLTLSGEITVIHPVVDESGRNLILKGKFLNPQKQTSHGLSKNTSEHEVKDQEKFLMLPGMFVRVRLIFQTYDQAFVVPEEAILLQKEGHFVYKIRQSKAYLTPVTVGIRQNGYVQIREGLSPEDWVVTAGQIKLSNGMAVHMGSPAVKKEKESTSTVKKES